MQQKSQSYVFVAESEAFDKLFNELHCVFNKYIQFRTGVYTNIFHILNIFTEKCF